MIFDRLRLDHGSSWYGRVFWYYHNAFPNLIEFMVTLVSFREGFDHNIFANPGVFIDNCTLDISVASDSERRAVVQCAVPVSAHNDRILDDGSSADNGAQANHGMFNFFS